MEVFFGMCVILLIGFSSFAIARRIFKVLDAKGNAWAVPISVLFFLIVCAVFLVIAFVICIYNMKTVGF